MVPFAGYQMPLQYSKGIIHEHLHCRSQASFFDISHMGQCLVLGDDAAAELEQLTPSDITGLKTGAQKYTVLTNGNGGIIDDIIVTRIDEGLMIIVNAACKEKDFAYLKNHLSVRCDFKELPDQALLALQGPAAATVIARFSSLAVDLPFMHACEIQFNGISATISRSGYTGEDGFEISVANHHAEQLACLLLAEDEVEAAGLGARDTLRLEAGLSLYGHELNETITPVEAGLKWIFKKTFGSAQGKTFDWTQAKFPGAVKILNQLHHGSEKIRAGLVVESKIPVRDGAVIIDDVDTVIGYVTSGGFSPSLSKPVAMALLDRNSAIFGNTLYTRVRDRKIAVTVTGLPFVPHRYHRSTL